MIANDVKYARKSKEAAHKTIRSTVMFQGNYKEELRSTMDMIEHSIENNLEEYFTVDSILGGSNNLKVRIDDTEQGVERIVNCMFRHHHMDERYGNVHIDLVTTGLGIKSSLRELGKFSVVDRETMKEKVLKAMIECVKWK